MFFQVAKPPASLRVGERRAGVRVALPFPAAVLGTDSNGKLFLAALRLENLSATGLYMRVPCGVAIGAELACVIRFALDSESVRPGARVGVRGRVVRVEPQPEGSCGVALVFIHHQFLYPPAVRA